MQELKQRISKEGRNIGRGILKVDAFLNHRIDPDLMMRLGAEFARRFASTNPTLILTAETSGIAPALAAASAASAAASSTGRWTSRRQRMRWASNDSPCLAHRAAARTPSRVRMRSAIASRRLALSAASDRTERPA